MKSVIIKNLALPVPTEDGFDTFIDLRIQSNGKALMHCGMGNCVVYQVEEIETEEEK